MIQCDFHGWATKNDLLCSDGRIIRQNAFVDNDGQTVPLVWNHQHNDPNNVLGHALLENRPEGVYTYCTFNDTDNGKNAKILVEHGDISALSIYANRLKQDGANVLHGAIREVSLVYAGANPGASIQSIIRHSDDGVDYQNDDEGVIFTGEEFSLYHADELKKENEPMEEKKVPEEELQHADGEKTVAEIFDTLNEEQKTVVYALIGQALEDAGDNNEEDKNMKHNVFENDTKDDALMHAEILSNSIADAKRYGSLKESFLQHASQYEFEEGFDKLFPEPKALNNPPMMIREDDSWVAKVMNGVHHTPFSRIKSRFAQMDEAEARARGYIKGNMKKEIALATMKRSTTPTTVYIKMKMDRDDVIDITDFDVIAWQKAEMRRNLDRELAQAILIGDGRSVSSDDKINEQNIRPIVNDDELFTIQYTITEGVDYKIAGDSYSQNDSICKGIIRGARKARKNYKGSGNPTFFTTEDLLNDLLNIEDQNGREIYESVEKLAQAMRVKEIVTVPELEGLKDSNNKDIFGIIVNLADYDTGADKGGSVNMFDDFDIDFNQMKYLMETRMSGALVVPYSAIVLKKA